ncbi:MAG: hypothetical protein IPJ03_20350 [Ignavibacteriales bacterium]|nr:hypothetical protein [Ignavibacteriales bacterium]
MKRRIQIIPTGIPLVDSSWGGFYRGGSYLLIGQHKSGRTLLGLQFARDCASRGEVCLYFTNMRPKDLLIQAASIDFDLQQAMNHNLVIVVRVNAPNVIEENGDEVFVDYLKDISKVVEQYQPSKIVFDELTPFISFNNIKLLEETFLETIEKIEDSGTTSLFVLGMPATNVAQNILNILSSNVTGMVYLLKEEKSPYSGWMSISPNIGHTEGEFKARYSIEAYKGIVIEKQDLQPVKNFNSEGKLERQYRNLSEINIPEEEFYTANLYSLDDFKLILNNQIALFKTTGQSSSVISLKLESSAESQGFISISQLKNAVRLSIDKKDKICVDENKILILTPKSDSQSLTSLLSKIKNNLPASEKVSLDVILQLISVLSIKIEDYVKDADDVFTHLDEQNSFLKNKYGFV